jgi:tRNA(Ile2) C34 agmatinyltransferase TiaS
MYCPYCGNEMELSQGYWYCRSGDMAFSRKMTEDLLAAIETTPFGPVTANQNSNEPLGMSVYCPRCTHQMTGSGDNTIGQVCPACGLSLRGRIIYHLVELHPHKRNSTK